MLAKTLKDGRLLGSSRIETNKPYLMITRFHCSLNTVFDSLIHLYIRSLLQQVGYIPDDFFSSIISNMIINLALAQSPLKPMDIYFKNLTLHLSSEQESNDLMDYASQWRTTLHQTQLFTNEQNKVVLSKAILSISSIYFSG